MIYEAIEWHSHPNKIPTPTSFAWTAQYNEFGVHNDSGAAAAAANGSDWSNGPSLWPRIGLPCLEDVPIPCRLSFTQVIAVAEPAVRGALGGLVLVSDDAMARQHNN